MNRSARLSILAGPDKGRDVNVPPAGIRLGRSSENDVALADPLLSRHHCRLDFTGAGELQVTDLDSANGTLVNGAAVACQKLKPGDQIHIGDTLLAVAAVEGLSQEGEKVSDEAFETEDGRLLLNLDAEAFAYRITLR